MKQILKNILVVTLAIFVLGSCSYNHRKPRVRYMAKLDMYNAVGYETYAKGSVFKDSLEAQTPVEGTIFRGEIPYEIPNTNEGYELAKVTLKSPLEKNDKNLEKGKVLFEMYCAVCHGNKGDGQGVLVQREKFLGVPNYKDRDINEGSIYHVIMYGKNLMGSHASQLTVNERWQIVQHVVKLRADEIQATASK